MASLLLGARILLAAVFTVAAVGKLVDRQGSRRSLAGFGVSERLTPAGAVLLPLAELATAVALVPSASARWGALSALILLAAFCAGIANAMARGRAPDCHCFGQLHSTPAGRQTLLRNAVLAVPAAIVLIAGPGPAIDTWVADRTAAELVAVATAVVAAILATLALLLWSQRRELRRELAEAQRELAAMPRGLPVGAIAPGFTLPTIRDETLSLDRLRDRGRPVLLLFVAPGCGPCRRLVPEVGRWKATLTEEITFAVISIGSAQANRAIYEEHGLSDLLVQEDIEVMSAYRVRVTPSALAVTADGKIASAVVEGVHATEALIRLTLRRGGGTPASALAGTNSPDL